MPFAVLFDALIGPPRCSVTAYLRRSARSEIDPAVLARGVRFLPREYEFHFVREGAKKVFPETFRHKARLFGTRVT